MSEPAKLVPPPLKNDCFALPADTHWTPVDEAHALLKERLSVCVGAEPVPLAKALGRVLAQDLSAARAHPPQPNSAVDGYGLAHAAVTEGPQSFPLVSGRSAAGAPFEGHVPAGQAIRILTGATVPAGVDTVILQEDVATDGKSIAFHGPLKRGANTRKAGEDVQQGDVILSKGRKLTPADLALAAATGVSEVQVFKPLRVGVISTGDELAEAGAVARVDQIYDANRPMLLGLIAQFGYEPLDLGRAPDDRATLKAFLDEAAARADVILTSGGASAGDEDHMSALLQETGSMTLWRLAIKPGRPLALGVWKGAPVFGLPGNPVAALVCSLIFAQPAMRVLAGRDWKLPQSFKVPAAFSKSKKAGRREFLRARIGERGVEVFGSEGSGRISGLSWAEGLVALPDEALEISEGDLVKYYPYSAFSV
ncbi:molybdopterin-binding protein [Shimia marina]|uniref:Molybdopterin molybdenumtransferase n=1 Tax=Shimia marina TaxID=321267 RepID=A0A0P1FFI7_9RHOB|nr:gephyrin-like molybdotransferase Glp [Shimia marina]CUH54250.1 Molybdopterin molybdenumtransferase [Shimia marina]SFD98576.1 molybdopterin molybdotransferase [Shimia marina]